ncbi:cation-translocating P-type ATPase [Conexibacter sp. DBS9H8]|uniref:heavy metal translocating P-type ATPase n=1 Tax=Conexibacter sp. DBS9H8 TaxID=2937801 RepID=UPI00200E293C|nr:heavy metal translocating P-type ATPase [Conexibacter sp. DBS9H8]
MAVSPGTSESGAATVELELDGMTCASCAARIEKRLNRLEGVSASVNYASEQASVAFDPERASVSALIAAVEAAGYHAAIAGPTGTPSDPVGPYRRRLLGAATLSVPVVLLALAPGLRFSGWEWVALALTVPVVFWAGWPFHTAALTNARHGAATMDTLVSVGTLAAWTWSAVVLLTGLSEPVYFDTAALITTFILAGRFLEARAKRRTGEATRALLALHPQEASLWEDGEARPVPAATLRVGDRFLVRPGERIPTDGIVEEGAAAVDASLLTGEPLPVRAEPGSEVTGATILTTGRLVVRATRVGEATTLAQIGRLVNAAQAGKAQVQRLADRVAGVFVPVVIALSLATLVGWLVSGADAAAAFTHAVAVLVIACPCALGLATPTALIAGTGRGAQLGLVFSGPEVLERSRRITTVLLDKTGTVTEGRMSVVAVIAGPGHDTEGLLAAAAAAERSSEHPVGAAILAHAAATGVTVPTAEAFNNDPGLGVRAEVAGHTVTVERPPDPGDAEARLPAELRRAVVEQEAAGRTVVVVGIDGAGAGVVALADRVKPTSAEAIAGLTRLGLRPVLLTGDNPRAAGAVAATLGIDEVCAGVRPDGKVAEVQRRQRAGEVVAMVGDGINDAAALTQADLGLAIGTGSDVAIEASDLTLVSGDLRAAVDAIALARRTLSTIKANLFWAFAYNVVALPLAITGVVDPIVASAAMAASSVTVVANSLTLTRFRSSRTGA